MENLHTQFQDKEPGCCIWKEHLWKEEIGKGRQYPKTLNPLQLSVLYISLIVNRQCQVWDHLGLDEILFLCAICMHRFRELEE